MLQVFFLLIWFVLLLGFGISAFVCMGIILYRQNRDEPYRTYTYLAIAFSLVTLLLWNIDLTGSESTDLQDGRPAFESNFGFPPPGSVEEIKVKNFQLHDAVVHWMCFTYDPNVIHKIIEHDRPQDTCFINTAEYTARMQELQSSTTNAPSWWHIPASGTDRIYYKKDFLDHSFSEYHFWSDTLNKRSYLQVHYFD